MKDLHVMNEVRREYELDSVMEVRFQNLCLLIRHLGELEREVNRDADKVGRDVDVKLSSRCRTNC